MRERCFTTEDHSRLDEMLSRRPPVDRRERAARLVALGGDVRVV